VAHRAGQRGALRRAAPPAPGGAAPPGHRGARPGRPGRLWTFNDFTPYLLTRGGPNFQTEILPIFIFRNAISSGQLGYGAAISTIVLGVNLVIALFYLRLLRERG
jgi:hypothetical protein